MQLSHARIACNLGSTYELISPRLKTLTNYHLHKFLARFREQLANISIENCVPLFGASSLMAIYVCAQSAMLSQPVEKSSSKIGMLMKLFNVSRGVETILAPYRGEVQQSSLSSLLHKDYHLVSDISR